MRLCPDCSIMANDQTCSECGWELDLVGGLPVWLSTADKNSHMFQDYLNNYESIGSDDLIESIQHPDYLTLQTDYLYSYLGDVHDLNVCEVGVGKGHLMERLHKAPVGHYTGIDICSAYLQTLNVTETTTLVIANAENIPYKNEFDLLIAADILEHVFSVGDFLYSANRALKMDGKFAVKVPYLEDINLYSQKRGCKYDYVHLRSFSKEVLKINLEGAGFEVVSFHYDGYWLSRLRKPFQNSRIFNFLKQKYMERYTITNDFIPYEISQFIGRLFMRPTEITAICKKINDLG